VFLSVVADDAENVPRSSPDVGASSSNHGTSQDISTHSMSCEGRPIPTPYVLCQFPADIQQLLDASDPSLASEVNYRKRIRKALCDDMAQYTL